MASFKQLKFYLLLLSGIAISIVGIYIFFSSSIAGSLFNLSKGTYAPDVFNNLGGKNVATIPLTITTTNGTTASLQVVQATTETQREQGLMHVKSMAQNQGMIFIFQDTPTIRSFWMKNTLIPLDMIFLSNNKQVVYIQHNALPCKVDPCQIYTSQFPAEYVIEANAGWAINNNIQTGNIVSF